MNKKLLAMGLLLSMTTGSAMAAANSGTTIGTGTLAVTGTVGTSTCSVTFPQNVTMPTVTTAMYQQTAYQNAMVQQPAGSIQFSGCNGQAVDLKVMGTGFGGIAGGKTIAYPKISNNQQGWLGLTFGVSKDNGSSFTNMKLDNTPLRIDVTNDTFALPVRVEAVKMSSNTATDIGQGNYSASFVVTATYA